MSERLWAPWRMQYVAGAPKETGCIFCTKPAGTDDPRNLILHRGTQCFIILNAFPYVSGHLMVSPYRHTADLNDLHDAEMLEIMAFTRLCVNLLKAEYRPDGFNLGVNLGRSAGAGIVDHVHWHIVPRWNGDTNFMPALSATRVIPESLEESYARLSRALAAQGTDPGADQT